MVPIITLENIKEFTDSYTWIGVVPNKSKRNEKYFVTLKTLKVELSDKTIVTINKGFEFDGSSVPRFLEVFLRRYGPFLFAALIHDWMYKTDYRRDELGINSAQKLADKEMLIWSNVTHYETTVSKIDNWIRYKAVRLFGKQVYKR